MAICDNCGKTFIQINTKSRNHQRVGFYWSCSRSCRFALEDRVYKEKEDRKLAEKPTCECPSCGIAFIKHPPNKKTCGKSRCYKEYVKNSYHTKKQMNLRAIHDLRRKLGFAPDDELVELATMRRLINRAIRKAGE